MNKMPVLFVGHGSPMNALDAENPFNQGFRRIVQKFAKPKAILMISAHWYGNRLQVTSGERPEMIYDFYGFPAALSQVQYPTPGSPELAGLMRSLLQPANVETNPERGFDHGAWAVLKHLYPEADIPVVQLSLNLMQPAQWHFNLAKKLAPLREQGVLVVGSGNIVHNPPRTRRPSRCGLRLGNRLPQCRQPRPCRAGQRHAGALRTAGGSRRALRTVARTLPAAALHRRAARTAGRYGNIQ